MLDSSAGHPVADPPPHLNFVRRALRISACHVFLCAAVFSTSCSTAEPDAFYLLTAEGPGPEGVIAAPEIGVGPIEIPGYIERFELVFQSSPNRFEIPSNHRWAGDLQENITSVLTTNLARRLHPRGVVSYPFASGIAPATRVAVQIHRFHALTGEDAVLEATWFITGEVEEDTITRTATFHRDLFEDGYEGVVAAESDLLATLAAAIAKDLQ